MNNPLDPQISRLCDAGEIEVYNDEAATALVRALAEQVPAHKPAPGEGIG